MCWSSIMSSGRKAVPRCSSNLRAFHSLIATLRTFRIADATMRCGGFMGKSRRQFLAETSLGVLAAAVGVRAQEQNPAGQNPADLPPGAPPAFGAGPAVGPEVSPSTFAEAEKLVQVQLTPPERTIAA